MSKNRSIYEGMIECPSCGVPAIPAKMVDVVVKINELRVLEAELRVIRTATEVLANTDRELEYYHQLYSWIYERIIKLPGVDNHGEEEENAQ